MRRPSKKEQLEIRLRDGPVLLLDGATGTEIESRGTPCDLPLWSTRALIESPDRVREIHREYATAGAEIITANTFRTQQRTLQSAEKEYPGLGERDEEITRLAVALAQEGVEQARSHSWVAGSIAPLEDCYQPEKVPGTKALELEHARHADNLARAGVDLILIETMNTTREAAAASRAAQATGLPFWISFVTTTSGQLLCGESLSEAIDEIRIYSPSGIGINCLPASTVNASLRVLQETGLRFGLHTNLGIPGSDSEKVHRAQCTPERFAQYTLRWAEAGANWVGGCCGTTPAHTAAASRALHAD